MTMCWKGFVPRGRSKSIAMLAGQGMCRAIFCVDVGNSFFNTGSEGR